MPKTKKFIDRKNAVTFNLVHRSQRDPLIADETAPQRVLVPINVSLPPGKDKKPELTAEQRKAEQQKYGIYFDDDYNYLQHLRDTKEVTMLLQQRPTQKRKAKADDPTAQETGEKKLKAVEKLQLPSSVFASEVEEEVGLLNRAAPQGLRLDLDPDVVAALDEDFDFDDPDNELEDNFMELAMAEGGSDEEYSNDDGMSQDGGSEGSFSSDGQYGSDGDHSQDGSRTAPGRMPDWDAGADETRSRFSQYSMSSSVIRRNEGLSMLDRRFEKMFAEYDDTEVGALDCEEIEGSLPPTDDALLRAAEELSADRQRYRLDKEKEIARIIRLRDIAEESSESETEAIEVREKEKWDCESILTTYSNLYNHPKIIDEPKTRKIKVSKNLGIPVDALNDASKLTAKTLARFDAQNRPDSDDDASRATVLSTLSALSIRPRDETPEEKRDRKRLLKEYRKERRLEKKANKEAFRDEKKVQEKILLNNKLNVQGRKIV